MNITEIVIMKKKTNSDGKQFYQYL